MKEIEVYKISKETLTVEELAVNYRWLKNHSFDTSSCVTDTFNYMATTVELPVYKLFHPLTREITYIAYDPEITRILGGLIHRDLTTQINEQRGRINFLTDRMEFLTNSTSELVSSLENEINLFTNMSFKQRLKFLFTGKIK